MNQQERRLYLIRELLQETQEPSLTIPTDFLAQKQLLRGLMNIRPPRPISQSFLRIQDAYLQEEQRKKGIVSLDTLSPIQPGIYLWRGDITTLSCDAIVNAASSKATRNLPDRQKSHRLITCRADIFCILWVRLFPAESAERIVQRSLPVITPA